jgi:hypothetical protein
VRSASERSPNPGEKVRSRGGEATRKLPTLLDGTEFLLKIDAERGSRRLFLTQER